KGLSGLIKARKITVVEGEGKLTGKDEVTVDGKVYKGKNVLLGTAAQPKTLGLEIDGKKVMPSAQALTMDRVPESAIVLGGGLIGVEFASVWRSYGTEVTVVEALKNLVPVQEESSSKLLERAFRKRKIKSELGKPF